jgi:hypothetical protein
MDAGSGHQAGQARSNSIYSGRAATSAPYTGAAASTRLRHSSIEASVRASVEGGGLAGKYSHISLLHRGR